MPKIIKLPTPTFPSFLEKLPGEEIMDRLLDKMSDTLERSAMTQFTRKIEDRFPIIEGTDVPTPLGKFSLPRLELPNLQPPKMDERRKEIVKAAIADDISSLVEKIPYLGMLAGPIADSLEDIAMAKLRGNLRPDEVESFYHYDKISPITTLAVFRTFIKHR